MPADEGEWLNLPTVEGGHVGIVVCKRTYVADISTPFVGGEKVLLVYIALGQIGRVSFFIA